jgi:prefoldin subunit 5
MEMKFLGWLHAEAAGYLKEYLESLEARVAALETGAAAKVSQAEAIVEKVKGDVNAS